MKQAIGRMSLVTILWFAMVVTVLTLAPATAQPPPVPPAPGGYVKLPVEVQVQPGLIIVAAETNCPELEWWAPEPGLQMIPANLLKDSKTAVAFAMTPGRFRLQAIGAKDSKPFYALTVVVVGGVPPSPGPGPGPTPGPGPIPIPGDGLRVMIVTDPAKPMTWLDSAALRDWLTANTAKDSDGKTPAWRKWPDGSDATNESKVWRDAYLRPRKSVPWLIISNGANGFEGPLTATSAKELIDLLSKYK